MTPALALGALLLAAPFEPSSPSPVVLALQDCPAVPRDQLARLLRLELDAPVLTSEDAGGHAVRVHATCAQNAVHLTVDDPATGQSLRRELVFPAEEGEVFVRVLTLVIAELVLTGRATPASGQAAVAPVDGVRPAPPAATLARAAEPAAEKAASGHAHVMAFGQALGPFSGLGVAWGGGLRVGWSFASRWFARSTLNAGPVLESDLATARTRLDRSLGAVQASLWSATVRASLRLRVGAAWFDAGAGGRFGLAQLQGQPADATVARGGTAGGTWAGPTLHAGLGARLGHVAVALGVEGGQVLRAVSGLVDQDSPVAIKGRWACATLAAGWTQ